MMGLLSLLKRFLGRRSIDPCEGDYACAVGDWFDSVDKECEIDPLAAAVARLAASLAAVAIIDAFMRIHESLSREEGVRFPLFVIGWAGEGRIRGVRVRFSWAGFKVMFVPHLSVRVRQRVGPSHGVRRRQTVIFVPPRPRPRFGVMIRLRGPV